MWTNGSYEMKLSTALAYCVWAILPYHAADANSSFFVFFGASLCSSRLNPPNNDFSNQDFS